MGYKSSKTADAAARPSVVGPVPVLDQEQPWTGEELARVRSGLVVDGERLSAELTGVERDLVVLMRESGEGSGDDQADAGAATWEREHELSLANNARHLKRQTEHAIERIDAGGYGVCESCENAIGKQRLQAFPRATLCMPCKRRQERR
ncbi:hypothetical protein BH23ACT6_BH23ACT6_03510 [soil metagenome]